MFTTFTLLLAAGAGFRFALAHLIRERFGVALAIPQPLAIGVIALAALPGWASPLVITLPLGLVLGFVLPDLLFRRV